MKKTGKVFVSVISLGVLLNNVAYATSEVAEDSNGGSNTKYIFMGIAALVIILLLYLGYKMDTKENDTTSSKTNKDKLEKKQKKLSEKAEVLQQNSGKYEADDDGYEADEDIFTNDDLNDVEEYNDDEDSLFSVASNEDEKNFTVEDDDSSSFSVSNDVEDIEETGEEFDTSIIDGLEDNEEVIESKKNSDETMVFDSSKILSSGMTLEDEIDKLDDIDNSEIDLIEKNDDSFIENLKKFEQPESDFVGFSVASKKEKKSDDVKETSKPKKYTKSKKEVEENIIQTNSVDNDFLSQMEANLQKSQEDRLAKKESKTTKRSTKKKEN